MKYIFEWNDVSTVLTILNVTLIICGFWFAPIFGLLNCGLGLTLNIKDKAHANLYLTQAALIALNIYFLL